VATDSQGRLRLAEGFSIPNPGSLQARYDFSQYISSATQNFTDLTGNGYDLVDGSITDVTESIGGKQAGNFDGQDDSVSTDIFTLAEPFTVAFVARVDNPSNGDFYAAFESDDGNQQISYRDDNDNWFWNSDPGGVSGGNVNHRLILFRVSDFGDTILRTDGVERARTNNGENNMELIRLGSRGNTQWYFQGAIGEVLVYKNDQQGSFVDIESYLNDKWNLNLGI